MSVKIYYKDKEQLSVLDNSKIEEYILYRLCKIPLHNVLQEDVLMQPMPNCIRELSDENMCVIERTRETTGVLKVILGIVM